MYSILKALKDFYYVTNRIQIIRSLKAIQLFPLPSIISFLQDHRSLINFGVKGLNSSQVFDLLILNVAGTLFAEMWGLRQIRFEPSCLGLKQKITIKTNLSGRYFFTDESTFPSRTIANQISRHQSTSASKLFSSHCWLRFNATFNGEGRCL